MTRDVTDLQRIETILYSAGVKKSGELALAIHEQLVGDDNEMIKVLKSMSAGALVPRAAQKAAIEYAVRCVQALEVAMRDFTNLDEEVKRLRSENELLRRQREDLRMFVKGMANNALKMLET